MDACRITLLLPRRKRNRGQREIGVSHDLLSCVKSVSAFRSNKSWLTPFFLIWCQRCNRQSIGSTATGLELDLIGYRVKERLLGMSMEPNRWL